MKKFAELQYVRPNMEKIFARVSGDIAVLKEAKSYEEFRNAYMDYVEADTELETSKTIAHVRNTINLLDEFYEAEMVYFNSQMPKYEILKKEMGEVIVASPFKAEMEKEFGAILIQNMEAQKQLSDESIVDDQVKEAELVSRFMKTQAAATVEFKGEQIGNYGLLKIMQSTDRAERKEAFEAWAKLYEGIAPTLEEVYDGLVKVRAGMAKKLGFKSFIRWDICAAAVLIIRKRSWRYSGNRSARSWFRQRQSCTSVRRKLLESIHSIIMTNPSLLRPETRFRSEIRNILSAKPRRCTVSFPRRAESSLIS